MYVRVCTRAEFRVKGRLVQVAIGRARTLREHVVVRLPCILPPIASTPPTCVPAFTGIVTVESLPFESI